MKTSFTVLVNGFKSNLLPFCIKSGLENNGAIENFIYFRQPVFYHFEVTLAIHFVGNSA